MNGFSESPARRLGSASMRYQRPEPGWPWPPAPSSWPSGTRASAPRAADEVPSEEGTIARSPRMTRLEAVLFLAEGPLSSRKIAQLANLADGTEARTLVGALNRLYDAEDCAFRAVEVAGGFQLMTRPEFAPWLRRLRTAPVEVRLSAPALETLAVVAYRQPVLRADVEAIRGVQCGEILRQLMDRDLVRIAGRSEDLGRPFLYGTTRQFLQVFGLRHLDELPSLETLQALELPEPPADVQNGQETTPIGQATVTSQTEEESNVKSQDHRAVVPDDVDETAIVALEDGQTALPLRGEDDPKDYDDDDFDEDDYDDEDLDDEDVDDEDVDDEEDNDWEEVTDDEDEEEDEDEEGWDDDEDDWGDEDDDWDDDDEEDDDWGDEDDDWDNDDEDEKDEG